MTCECTVCGIIFGSVSSFDMHRVGKYTIPDTRKCLSEKVLIKKGLRKNEKGVLVKPAPIISSCGVDKVAKK